MSDNLVVDKFDELLLSLDEEGWNDDIISDVIILKRKYKRELLNDK